MGGMDMQAGRSLTTGQSYGSFQNRSVERPQQTVSGDAHAFVKASGIAHDIEVGSGFRTTDAWMLTEWPGNGILAIENSPTDFRAQVFRQGNGGNRANYFDISRRRHDLKGRATINVGLRYDHQWGRALPSVIAANKAFPTLVPGLTFAGYDSPFTLEYLLAARRPDVRTRREPAARSRAQPTAATLAQLSPTTIGVLNPASTAGSATYRWVDTNNDHFAQADEVLTDQRLTQGGGFNPANPTAVTSANQIDANLRAPQTHSFVAGVDRELMAHLAVQVNYSYTRTTDLFGNYAANITPRVGVTLADYSAADRADRHLAGRRGLQRADVRRQRRQGRRGRRRVSDDDGARLLDRLPRHRGRVGRSGCRTTGWAASASRSTTRASTSASDAGRYDTNGNPTPTFAEPLVDGGQFAPVEQREQRFGQRLHQREVAVQRQRDVSGAAGHRGQRQRLRASGLSLPAVPDAEARRRIAVGVLVTPAIDYFRYDNVWDMDVRAARAFKLQARRCG